MHTGAMAWMWDDFQQFGLDRGSSSDTIKGLFGELQWQFCGTCWEEAPLVAASDCIKWLQKASEGLGLAVWGLKKHMLGRGVINW